MATFEEMLSLTRYFVWATSTGNHFHDEIKKRPRPKERRTSASDVEIPHMIEMGLIAYWYASVHVVIEGWKDLKLHDPAIDKLLESENVENLRRFRNGIFHYQRKWRDERFLELAEGAIEGNPIEREYPWFWDLTHEFARYFGHFISEANKRRIEEWPD